MSKPSVEQLMAVESRLNRSLMACVAALLASFGWSLAMARTQESPGAAAGLVAVGLFVAQLGSYVWFAVAVGAAARVLGETPWKYVVWVLAAPFLARIPIPIVSNLILASPLSIKFLLGGQLQSAIRQRPFED